MMCGVNLDAVQQTAKITIWIKKMRKKPGFNKICEDAVQRRKIARDLRPKDTNNDESAIEFSRWSKKYNHNIIRFEKRKYIQNTMKDAEQDFRLNRTRDMYKRVNGLKGDFKKKERILKNDDVMLITSEEEISEKWRKYFDKLLKCEEPTEKCPFNIKNINTQDCPHPTFEEIKVQ